MQRLLVCVFSAAVLAFGCSAQPAGTFEDDEGKLGDGGSVDGPACKPGRDYDGFGGEKIGDTGRAEGEAGQSHRRVKPLSALRTEYARVLGKTPASLAAQSDSIGKQEPRFFAEPQANAVALYSLYVVAFDGCVAQLDSGPFASAPTMESARTQCHELGRKYWSRTLSNDEAEACANLAVNELPAASAPNQRWGHACASLLTSAGFLSY
jgi:hypothetical protein